MNTLFEIEKPKTRAKISPREYQVDAHDGSFQLWDSGEIGVLLRMATGTGKTLTASIIADTWLRRSEEARVMVVSYERQLVWQFAQEIEDYLGITPTIEMEKETADLDSRIVVASRATILPHAPATERQVEKLAEYGISDLGVTTERMAKTYIKHLIHGIDQITIADDIKYKRSQPEAAQGSWSRLHKFRHEWDWLVIFDEAHKHSYGLPSVKHIVDWFERNPRHRRCGLTATPKRADQVSIGDRMFPGIAIDYPLFSKTKSCAVGDGYAVPYIQRYIEVEGVDFKSIKRVSNDAGADFDETELARLLGDEAQIAKLVLPMLDMAESRRGLIFSPTVQMAKDVALFINARVPTVCDCGKRKWHSRKLIGDGAQCDCGVLIDTRHVVSDKDQCRQLDGNTPDHERKAIYAGHHGGEFQFLSVCGMCLAKGTMVLTDCGEVPIEKVTTAMRLWDGVEFVSHDGVVSKGERPVIRYAGLTATGDHNVWTDDGWTSLAACKQFGTPIRVSAINGQAVRESCGYYREDCSAWKEPTGWAGNALRWVRETVHQGVQRIKEWPGVVHELCEKFWRSELAVDAVPIGEKAVRKQTGQALQGLRRAWDSIPVFFSGPNGPVDHGEFGASQGTVSGSERQQQALRAGEHRLGQRHAASEQPETAEVFDILNAGPRHRFTANGLIVSNCREGYNDPDISVVAVFRPVSKKASSLAEQMKGRGCRPLRSIASILHTLPDSDARRKAIAESAKPNCLIIDLVGITGLADCASTADIYTEGLPDDVRERAAKKLVEGETDDVDEAVDQAKREHEEEKERIRLEREAAERKAKEEFERRAKAQADAKYSVHEIGTGSPRDSNEMSEGQEKFMWMLGMEIVGMSISKRQAVKIITALRQRLPLEEIKKAYGIVDYDAIKPSLKQMGWLAWKRIPQSPVKTPHDWRLVRTAYDSADEFRDRRLTEISQAKDATALECIKADVKLVTELCGVKIGNENMTTIKNAWIARKGQLSPSMEPLDV